MSPTSQSAERSANVRAECCERKGREKAARRILKALGLCQIIAALVTDCAPTQRHSTSTSAATDPPIHYSIPDCSVRYRVTAVERLSTGGMGDHQGANVDQGIDTVIELEARPKKVADQREWELLPVMWQYLRHGKYRPFAVPDPGYAAIELTTDGRSWTEREGSTLFFRAAGSLIGLALLFPSLPDSNIIGATQDWRLDFPATQEVLVTEATRGHHPGLKGAALVPTAVPNDLVSNVPPEPLLAKVRLEKRTRVNGVPAAVYTMKAAYPVKTQMPLSQGPFGGKLPDIAITGELSLEGQYLILETGLLDATVNMTGFVEMSEAQPPKAVMRQQRSMHLHAQLIQACTGPTQKPDITPPSREEAAIDACGALAMAILEGSREKAIALLAPDLRQAQGDEALWATLSTYVRSRGLEALSPPVFVEDSDIKSGADVTIVTQASTKDRTQENTVTPIEVEFTMRQSPKGWVAERISARATFVEEELLELSKDRVYVSP